MRITETLVQWRSITKWLQAETFASSTGILKMFLFFWTKKAWRIYISCKEGRDQADALDCWSSPAFETVCTRHCSISGSDPLPRQSSLMGHRHWTPNNPSQASCIICGTYHNQWRSKFTRGPGAEHKIGPPTTPESPRLFIQLLW